MGYAFDTLKASNALVSKGFEKEQADTIVEIIETAITDTVATKDDVVLLSHHIDLLKTDISQMELKLTIRLGGLMIAGIGILYTLLRFTII